MPFEPGRLDVAVSSSSAERGRRRRACRRTPRAAFRFTRSMSPPMLPSREGERHPRLEVRDDARLHLGMLVRGSSSGRRPTRSSASCSHAGLAAYCAFSRVGIDEQLHAAGRGRSSTSPSASASRPMRVDVVRLDAVEVVLGLRVDHAEHRVGVGLAVDVRDAPVVADDGDVLRLLLPAREFAGVGFCAASVMSAATSRKASFLMGAPSGRKKYWPPGNLPPGRITLLRSGTAARQSPRPGIHQGVPADLMPGMPGSTASTRPPHTTVTATLRIRLPMLRVNQPVSIRNPR